MMNCSRKKIVFVPSCMLCSCFQAKCTDENTTWAGEILQLLLQYNAGIVPICCPEVSFEGYEKGLSRMPHGVSYYEKIPEFMNYCELLGENTAQQIVALDKQGYAVCAVIGIEHSPSCAINYMYTRAGTIKRKGILYQVIADKLIDNNLDVSFVGVNRRHWDKARQKIQNLLD